MASTKVTEEIEAPIDKVWEKVKDFADISAWAPAGKILDVEGEGVGAIRRVQGGDSKDMIFVERCEAIDPESYTFSYGVVTSPIPMKNYIAVVKLSDLGPSRCGIEWSCRFEPEGVPEEQMIEGIQTTYKGFISSLRASVS